MLAKILRIKRLERPPRRQKDMPACERWGATLPDKNYRSKRILFKNTPKYSKNEKSTKRTVELESNWNVHMWNKRQTL